MADQLPLELAQFIQEEIASGRFRSEEGVIREGLALLKQRRNKLEMLRKDLEPALARLGQRRRSRNRPGGGQSQDTTAPEEPSRLKSLVWDRDATRDLNGIWLYIAQDYPGAADRFIDHLSERCASLQLLEKLGRHRSEIAPDLRSILVGQYVVFY